jgi:hypothetical protein
MVTLSSECCYILFSTHDGNQIPHTGDVVEHTDRAAYSRYDVPSKAFRPKYRDNNPLVFGGKQSRDSYGLDGLGSIPGSARFFSSLQLQDWPWVPTILLSNGYWGLYPPGIKRQRRETHQEWWSYTSTPPHFMA